jgi:hypothetical protein
VKLGPGLRKATLVIHLTCASGWLGAVVAYLALDLAAALSNEPPLIRASWVAMGLLVSSVIVPLATLSLITGVVIAVGTSWGLFRHWWVVISLLLTLVSVVVLFVEWGVIARTAAVAAAVTTPEADLLELPNTLPHSVGGLAVLLLIQLLNVVKPQGLTPYGWRKLEQRRSRSKPQRGARS